MFLRFLFRLDWKVFSSEFFPLRQRKEREGLGPDKLCCMCAFSQLCYKVLRKLGIQSGRRNTRNWSANQRFIEQQLSDRYRVDLERYKVREDIFPAPMNKAKL